MNLLGYALMGGIIFFLVYEVCMLIKDIKRRKQRKKSSSDDADSVKEVKR